MDVDPIPFEGDYFGNYDPAFFDDTHIEEPDASESESSDEDDDDDEQNGGSLGWEPEPGEPRPDHDATSSPGTAVNPAGPALPTHAHRTTVEEYVKRKTFSVRYPKPAGEPMEIDAVPAAAAAASTYRAYAATVDASQSGNPYAPFASRLDWQMARWAKLRGSGSTAFTELLAIEEVAERLALSYKTAKDLNNLIDKKLPNGRPKFQRQEIVVSGEAFEVFFRDILECIEALFGDPEFTPILQLVPERHYADGNRTIRVYFDMNTGKWWWATQKELEKENPGATVVPVIISSDKTQLTVFGNKTAYLVYMTLGNLPKEVRCKPSRRGQILLAYLPTSRLLHITNKAARRRVLANLFHTCMTRILEPLAPVSVTGMPLASGDGVVRRGHPILAVYVGDYPEQVLVTGCKTGECPKCPVAREEVGEDTDTNRSLRNLRKVLDALDMIDQGPRAFKHACAEAGIKPLAEPFWADLPYTNIYHAITPDILHQLYQGIVKHLLVWLQDAFGDAEIDARCRRLPPNHNLRHFSKGLSNLSRVTGKEHQDIARILLGLIIDLRLPNGVSPARIVRATRAILDFLYLAQYPTHTTQTLCLLDDALTAFHANKDVFVDLGIRAHWQLPKLHSLDHYRRSIEHFGTTDNYDTQYSERLHIDMTKDAFRATNKKDELVQMTKWLERKEKILRHEKYVNWRLQPTPIPVPHRHPHGRPRDSADKPRRRIDLTRHPSATVPLDQLQVKYGATYFRDALSRFVVRRNSPHLTPAQQERASASIYLNFQKISVYHKIKFWVPDPDGVALPGTERRDVIHIRPVHKNKYGDDIAGRFDTALVRMGTPDSSGLDRFCVAQVRLVFKLPPQALHTLFPGLPDVQRPNHLAYVEWFTPFVHAHRDHGLYKISRSLRRAARLASVIPVEQLERSCHLIPEFGPIAPRDWTRDNVLDKAKNFYFNAFSDRFMYKLVF
ncbi:hypothetical protein L226DRAFT_458001 [Lentinus tigrinus ALCF2SS1-7]|uniref:Uncharacterized protein n=1 Tax=Lentinus tigrinus ALCF2SS1-6 TaxID=1328759 RepID=A0A5C2SHP0_9APHY|nr:hypothetical protein L227DRAFT_498291 [Lentinus tigrinus ALCF2SS1-6]RPD77613.1 hypothetical protein L226DRAFT_458001 [Lentinus tigrinus ALCF2SS1-7]